MNRCASCNGIIAPTDVSCYVCGEPIPGGARRARLARRAAGHKSSASLTLPLCLGALATAAYSFVEGFRLGFVLSLTLFSVVLLARLVGERGGKKTRQPRIVI